MAASTSSPPSMRAPAPITSAASVKNHGAQTFGIPLPLSGEPGVECRSERNRETLVFTFTDSVVSGNAAVTSGSAGISGSPTSPVIR